jgi:hypothetical protein
VAAVEFAFLAMIFFTFVFGIMEVSRLLFVYNTLQEVTRRAASAAVNVYPSDPTAIAKVKQYAVFRTSPGELLLASPITDKHIRLDYLRFDLSVIPQGSLPASAASNRAICMADPHAANCIRFVSASVCDLATRSARLWPSLSSTSACLSIKPRQLHRSSRLGTSWARRLQRRLHLVAAEQFELWRPRLKYAGCCPLCSLASLCPRADFFHPKMPLY